MIRGWKNQWGRGWVTDSSFLKLTYPEDWKMKLHEHRCQMRRDFSQQLVEQLEFWILHKSSRARLPSLHAPVQAVDLTQKIKKFLMQGEILSVLWSLIYNANIHSMTVLWESIIEIWYLWCDYKYNFENLQEEKHFWWLNSSLENWMNSSSMF